MKNIPLLRGNLSVFIFTSNSSMHCVPAWAYLFNKFWPWNQDVKVLGYDQPTFILPENFEYISLGKQRGPKYWSDDIRKSIEGCGSDLVYLSF